MVNCEVLGHAHTVGDELKRYVEAKYLLRIVENFTKVGGKRLLDFGAGSGGFCGYLREQCGVEATLYEPSVESLVRAKELFHFNDDFLVGSVDDLSGRVFDIVTCLSVYCYIDDREEFWKNVCDLLCVGGFVFVEVNNRKGLYNFLTGQKVDSCWNVSVDEVPKVLELVRIVGVPFANHVWTFFGYGRSSWIIVPNLCIAFFAGLFGLNEHVVYVFRKSGGMSG